MTSPSASLPISAFLDEAVRIVGQDAVLTTEGDRAYYGNDLFFWDEHVDPLAVVRPTTREQVPAIVRAAVSHDVAIYVRGGGMSYTNGYGPALTRSIILDLGGLNRIIEVDPLNRFITLEAGCTWAKLCKPWRHIIWLLILRRLCRAVIPQSAGHWPKMYRAVCKACWG